MEENNITDEKKVKTQRTFGTELKTRTDITRISKEDSGKGTVMYQGYIIQNKFRADGDPSKPIVGEDF